jgi:HD superfamily phosphohydrolase
MHLAGLFARTWYGQWREALGLKDVSPRHPTVAFVEELLRLAGLLHDVGHGPFGHTFEQASHGLLGGDFPAHEKIGAAVIRRDLREKIEGIRRSPTGRFAEKERLRWEHVACLVDKEQVPEHLSLSRDESALVDQLRPIISGLFDVDRLDYLARDAYHGGTVEYGTMDVERLRTTLYFDQDGKIAIPVKSMPALRNMLLARLQMYETVYFHPRVRAFEVEAEVNMADMLRQGGFPTRLDAPDFLARHQELDDHWVYGTAISWSRERDGDKQRTGKAWVRLFNRQKRLWCTDEIMSRIEAKYLKLVADSIREVRKSFHDYLSSARAHHKTDRGSPWPGSVGSDADLAQLAYVDAPAFAAGLQDFLEPQSPYVLTGADGRPSQNRTAAEILQQLAGVNFVVLRFLAIRDLAQVVKDAAADIRRQFRHLLP